MSHVRDLQNVNDESLALPARRTNGDYNGLSVSPDSRILVAECGNFHDQESKEICMWLQEVVVEE